MTKASRENRRNDEMIWQVMAATAAASAPTPAPVRLPVQEAAVSPVEADVEVRKATPRFISKKIVIAGDSTAQVGSGWGGAFCADHVTSVVVCVDLGRGGRSSFSYRAEGSWDTAIAEAKTPGYAETYVLIQFAHNDQPGRPGRSTDLKREFSANIARYVEDVRAAGAIPILLTPVPTRGFRNGVLEDGLWPWSDAIRAVATRMKVLLIDVHAISIRGIQEMGPEAALRLAERPPEPGALRAASPGTTADLPKIKRQWPAITDPTRPQAQPEVIFDSTHLGPVGADYFSRLIAVELARLVPSLRPQLVEQLYTLGSYTESASPLAN